jgi:hypothetical protein
MGIGPNKTKGPTLSVVRIKRKQQRRKRRLVEAADIDWEYWDSGAKALGLNFAELARRALTEYVDRRVLGGAGVRRSKK